jgi:ribosomal protein S11
MRYKTGFAPHGMCYDPISGTALVVAALGSAAIAGGAQAYSASKQSTAAKKAAEAQERVGMANIEASLKAPQLAADAASKKLKAKQASATQTILTAPGGMQAEDANVNRSILGVG